jgi:MerR HTH family regulatory protein
MSSKDLKTSFLHRSESFYKLIELLSNGEGLVRLNEPNYTVGDTHLSYRVISHWDKNGIIPHSIQKEKGWHKFTFIEIVWLKIVSRLRDFGFSLKKIAKIKKQIMWFDKRNKNHHYSFLECYVSQAWFETEDCYIIVLNDGTVDIGSSLEIELAKRKLLPEKSDMLLVSLKGILNELGMNVKTAKTLLPMSEEEILISRILKENNNEVNMKFKKGMIHEIESTEVISENPNFTKINKGLKEGGAFGEVITKYENGKAQSVQVKRRQRFK